MKKILSLTHGIILELLKVFINDTMKSYPQFVQDSFLVLAI